MKPEKLTLCGWGPYKDKQEVDFACLKERGLFLICGATGAGKTTIFDAITYALYGNMSGEQREKNSVRSDFATADTPTYVELSMTHGGRPYLIYRNPEYLRPGKRNQELLVKEKEKAVLTEPDGRVTEGASEVTKRIQELLKLDYKQFKQLSMIAQGEFARLLSAPPSEKTRIFREIFGTNSYEKIAATLKVRSSGIYKEVMKCRHKMDENIDMLVRDGILPEKTDEAVNYYYREILDTLHLKAEEYTDLWMKNQQSCEQTDGQLQKLNQALGEAEKTRGLEEKLKQEKLRYRSLQAMEAEMESKKALLHRQEQAAQMVPVQLEFIAARQSFQRIQDEIASIKEAIRNLEQKRSAEKPFYEQREEIVAAYEMEQQVQEVTVLQRQREAAYAKKKKELDRLQEQYLQAEKEEEKEKAAYEQLDKAYRHGMAGILAGQLQEGEPCPVCGSKEHPKLAVEEGELPSGEQVQTRKERFEEKQSIRIDIHGRTTACLAQEKEVGKQLEELCLKAKQMQQEQEKTDPSVLSYIQVHKKQEFLDAIRSYEQRIAVIVEKTENLKRQIGEEKKANVRQEQLHAVFIAQLKAAGFQNEEEFQHTLVKESQTKQLREEIHTYELQCSANREMCTHLEKELSQRQALDIEKLQQQMELTMQDKRVLLEEQLLIGNRLQNMNQALIALEEKEKLLNQLMESYSLMKRLDDTANGNNKKRLVFEQYVLASYFEEILMAANLRLRGMSGGRYELRRMEQIQDGRSKDNLEIEVMDYYTGKYRSVKTLSGGEAFKASLALALGMSDVVQAGSGGIQVETLFIDEGFGSLDSESLEQACMTLQGLVERDRLIGIISHVPELAEKIGSQVQIMKTNAGSAINVMIS